MGWTQLGKGGSKFWNSCPAIRLFCIACFASNIGCSERPKAPDREHELKFLRVILAEKLLPYAHVEVPGSENIAILGEGKEQFLGLHLYAGQKQRNRGNRAEVSVDWPFAEGDRVRYEWRFRVPEEFQSDAPKNRWWIIGQWHDQPDTSRGETWDDFPSRSPPILIGIGELDGRTAIAIEYGPTQADKRGPIFIERGKWHHLAVEVLWSQKSDGSADVYFDDLNQPLYSFSGTNMHNGFQHYPKLGMYRSPEIATASWIHIDDVTIAKLPQSKSADFSSSTER